MNRTALATPTMRRLLISSLSLPEVSLFPQVRFFSTQIPNNLLGHSPMSPAVPLGQQGKTGKIPTAKDVSGFGGVGGVWAATSAKRDKLVELKGALEEGQTTLDDAASEQERLDLYLADGMSEIAKDSDKQIDSKTIDDFVHWLNSFSVNDLSDELEEAQFDNFLTAVVSKIDSIIPKEKYIEYIRDFMEIPDDEDDVKRFLEEYEQDQTNAAFRACALRYRLYLTRAAAEHLKDNWENCLKVTDGDMDRVAIAGETIEENQLTLSCNAVKTVLLEYAKGNSSTQFDAVWNLIDRDRDGLLDEVEMAKVAYLTLTPTGKGLQDFFEEAVDARSPLQSLDNFEETKESTEKSNLGFFARRQQRNAVIRLKKQFTRCVSTHFEDELEMPHRLRCIYSWAEKAHQNNKIDAVHIDTGFHGRKRYVELEPKISLAEFREVQKEHFTELDRISEEIIKSFREELWVYQGSVRERKELQRNALGFLAAVCAIDVAIFYI